MREKEKRETMRLAWYESTTRRERSSALRVTVHLPVYLPTCLRYHREAIKQKRRAHRWRDSCGNLAYRRTSSAPYRAKKSIAPLLKRVPQVVDKIFAPDTVMVFKPLKGDIAAGNRLSIAVRKFRIYILRLFTTLDCPRKI